MSSTRDQQKKAVDRNLKVYDQETILGPFTKKLMKLIGFPRREPNLIEKNKDKLTALGKRIEKEH